MQISKPRTWTSTHSPVKASICQNTNVQILHLLHGVVDGPSSEWNSHYCTGYPLLESGDHGAMHLELQFE